MTIETVLATSHSTKLQITRGSDAKIVPVRKLNSYRIVVAKRPKQSASSEGHRGFT